MVRFKNRYITVQIDSPLVPDNKPLSLVSKIFHETVQNKIQQLYGDYGIAAIRTGFLTKYCNEVTRIVIIRCRHGPHKFVTSSLPFITKIGKLDVSLRTLHVGATLKHSFKFIQKHQRAYLDKMWATLKTDEERKSIESAVMDFTKTDVSIHLDQIVYILSFIFLSLQSTSQFNFSGICRYNFFLSVDSKIGTCSFLRSVQILATPSVTFVKMSYKCSYLAYFRII